jgi:hypothetical protein
VVGFVSNGCFWITRGELNSASKVQLI